MYFIIYFYYLILKNIVIFSDKKVFFENQFLYYKVNELNARKMIFEKDWTNFIIENYKGSVYMRNDIKLYSITNINFTL
jgi:hypothetical protein